MEIELEPQWPPQYRVRRSKRARRLSIRVSETRGLEIVLPMGMNERHIQPMLEQHRDWVLDKLADIQLVDHRTLPSQIHITAINQLWQVEIDARESQFVRVYPNRVTQTLLLQGPSDCYEQYRQLIKKWLMRQAKKHLKIMMDELCEQHGFEYNRLSIRAAKTRWGSCTSKKNISLNYKLLLMPKAYAEHIILHELCHTVHMNHSKAFWDLLERVDVNTKQHHVLTREFKNELTLWLDSQAY